MCRNVAEALVSKGLATVVRYRQGDDQRSSCYDDLLKAEDRAEKKAVGMHSKKESPMIRVADISGVSHQCNLYCFVVLFPLLIYQLLMLCLGPGNYMNRALSICRLEVLRGNQIGLFCAILNHCIFMLLMSGCLRCVRFRLFSIRQEIGWEELSKMTCFVPSGM